MFQRQKLYRTLGFLILILAVLHAARLQAQVDTGAVVGTVKDQSGAVIPSAKVTLTNEATNYTISTKTEADGSYIFTPDISLRVPRSRS